MVALGHVGIGKAPARKRCGIQKDAAACALRSGSPHRERRFAGRGRAGSIPEYDAVAVVHAGGLGREDHDTLDESPDEDSHCGHATGEQPPCQGDDKLDGATGVEAQVIVVDAEHTEHNGQQAGGDAAFLHIAGRRRVVLGGIVGLLGHLAILGWLVLGRLLLLGILRGAILGGRTITVAGLGLRLRGTGGFWHGQGEGPAPREAGG